MSKLLRYLFRLVFRLVLFLVSAMAIGCLVPQSCNRDIHCEDRITVYFINHGYHASLALPTTSGLYDWRQDFPYASDSMSLVQFGWGDKTFYMSRGFPIDAAIKALILLNPAVIQVVSLRDRDSYILSSAEVIPVALCPEQYSAMVEYIRSSFVRDSLGRMVYLAEGFYPERSGFYDALGTYYGFNNCNTWIGGALRASGLRTPLWDGIPQSLRWHLPDTTQQGGITGG